MNNLLPVSLVDDSTISNDEPTLQNNKWSLIFYGFENEEKRKILRGTSYSLEFNQHNQVAGRLNCNTFFAAYESDENSLNIREVDPSKKTCLIEGIHNLEDYLNQNSFFVNAISTAESYLIENDLLTVTSNDGSQLVFEVK